MWKGNRKFICNLCLKKAKCKIKTNFKNNIFGHKNKIFINYVTGDKYIVTYIKSTHT